ncbi:MAG: DUF86 domain-containing protein [Nanoarchaeota archaeon]|nr:DUF86 domain-containing protein [Nanoarchaeota archaeon]
MTKKESKIFIEHILNNILDIENFVKGVNKEILKKDIMRQKAIIKSIEIIGEASNNLPKDFKEEYSQVPWSDIIGMRNKLSHHYFGIDLNVVWKTIKEDIPELKKKILKIKKEDLVGSGMHGSDREQMKESRKEFVERIEEQTFKGQEEDKEDMVENLLEHTKEKKKPLTRLYGDLEKVDRDEIEDLTSEIIREVAEKKKKEKSGADNSDSSKRRMN